jgi:hypothetical protein
VEKSEQEASGNYARSIWRWKTRNLLIPFFAGSINNINSGIDGRSFVAFFVWSGLVQKTH